MTSKKKSEKTGNDDGLILKLHDDSWDIIMEGLELLLEKKRNIITIKVTRFY
mgnify:CR=1 FL=1